MQVSVIIPVFNAEKFVEKAVLSALAQEETGEVLIIEDGSTDASLAICRRLAEENEKVRLFQHPDNGNHGPGASRNVGLRKAKCPFVAFLDADDFYLENRFRSSMKIFEGDAKVDGVYEAAGFHYYSGSGEMLDIKCSANKSLVAIKGQLNPSNLFEEFFMDKNGWFTLDALVVKKELINRIGFFDESLRQTEDTDFILRLSLIGRLISGRKKKPVVLIGIHKGRSVYRREEVNHFRYLLFRKWHQKVFSHRWNKELNRFILRGCLSHHPVAYQIREYRAFRLVFKSFLLILWLIKKPSLALKLI